jgi:O-antigen/teichoic acid export membrane protein
MVVTNAVLVPTGPAYAEAKAQSDWAWIRKTLVRSALVVLVAAVIPMLLVAPFLPKVILWWTRGGESPAISLVWWLVIWNAVLVLEQPVGYFLAGISKVRRATIYSILTTIAAPAAMLTLIPRLGIIALPLGLIIGFVPFVLIGNVAESLVILREALSRHRLPVSPGTRNTTEDSLVEPAPVNQATPG